MIVAGSYAQCHRLRRGNSQDDKFQMPVPINKEMQKKTNLMLVVALLLVAIHLTCELTFGEQIVAWGRNDYGECNVPAGDDFVAVTAGLVHGVALRSDSSVVAWGSPSCGQLDCGCEGHSFIAISSSQRHTLALKSDGSLLAWGCNDDGECDVPMGNGFLAIAAGFYHSIAIKPDGSLAAWGYNNDGQCDVPVGNDFVAIAGGFGQSLAIKSNGSLVAWGSDRFGLNIVPEGNDFTAIASGFSHNVALRSDGSLVAWGYNYSGQCDVPTGSDFSAIAANSDYCLALRSDGSLTAWGYNSTGQCDVPIGNSFTAIAAGYGYASALTSAPAELVGIDIVGPEQVGENYHAQYKALANYQDGSTRNATDVALWQVEPAAIASIDEHGMLYTNGADVPEEVTIYAQYTEGVIEAEAQTVAEVYPSMTIHVPGDYNNIQGAIDAARDTDIVLVADGIYSGSGNYDISFDGKALVVRSENGPEHCIIDCQNLGRGFTFGCGETEDSMLWGFTITNGRASNGGGILCYDGSPVISNCIISANAVVGGNGDTTGWGGGLCCSYSNPTIVNCVFRENSTGYAGGAIWISTWYRTPKIINCTIVSNAAAEGSGVSCNGRCLISNCIIWDNLPQQIAGEMTTDAAAYSNIQGGCVGEGNIESDPLFADDSNGDYHLKSEGWRWNTGRETWTWDEATSRCIDAGNPGSLLGEEPLSVPPDPNNIWGRNLRINMGAYGGTPTASMPPYDWAVLSDTNNDGITDFDDFSRFAGVYTEQGDELPADFDRNGAVNTADLHLLVEDWLRSTSWY